MLAAYQPGKQPYILWSILDSIGESQAAHLQMLRQPLDCKRLISLATGGDDIAVLSAGAAAEIRDGCQESDVALRSIVLCFDGTQQPLISARSVEDHVKLKVQHPPLGKIRALFNAIKDLIRFIQHLRGDMRK
jgi:hypothetical protein